MCRFRFPPTLASGCVITLSCARYVPKGNEVAILAFGGESEAASARQGLAGLCEDIKVVGGLSEPGKHGRVGALFSELPYGAWRMRSPRMRLAVTKTLARGHFDLVLCDDIYLFKNLPVPFRCRSSLTNTRS